MSRPSDSGGSVLDSLGEEIIRIVSPVSSCMLLVVLLVVSLSSSSVSPLSSISSSSASSSIFDDLKTAVLTSIIFIFFVTLLTFFLVLLFYFRFIRFLKSYMAFSSLIVLGFLGGEISLLLLSRFDIPVDAITFLVLLANFAVVGVMAVFMSKMPISVNQAYLVVIGVLVAYWFTLLPEWTTWALLVAISLYDLAAVLLPGGPLRLLVELAISRDEEIPALVYEARPVVHRPGSTRGLWRERRDFGTDPSANSNGSAIGDPLPETRVVVEEESTNGPSISELSTPLIQSQPNSGSRREEEEEEVLEGIGLGSSGAIKLGLGDFIFYSVLVGRAALFDFMTVYACYLAIIAGLGVTLLLLSLYRKALPALPVSIALGCLFYLLTRTLLEVFVVQCSTNLLMF
ncbi:presenilin-like protein At2g29900 [Typha angustifolia]|uniref:presenilin-like protein At2g29900 n=1 Tax=Typha angustifolia TaxID=59011 RepID=UPI003C2C29B5